MQTRGAIVREAHGAYEVVELDLAEPLQAELTSEWSVPAAFIQGNPPRPATP